ncbi:MAG: hypothetical protein AAGD38_14805 [Acidobacteriota bacterium]
MNADTAIERILDALASEIRRRHGHIGEIETSIGRSRGYLSKVCAREWQISLDVLMSALEAMDIELDGFFATALDVAPASERYLEELDDGREDQGLAEIEELTRAFERDDL